MAMVGSDWTGSWHITVTPRHQPTHASTWSKKKGELHLSLPKWEFVLENQLEIKAEAKENQQVRVGLTANQDHVSTKWWKSKTLCKQRKFGSREKKTANQSAAKMRREGERSIESERQRERDNETLESWFGPATFSLFYPSMQIHIINPLSCKVTLVSLCTCK